MTQTSVVMAVKSEDRKDCSKWEQCAVIGWCINSILYDLLQL